MHIDAARSKLRIKSKVNLTLQALEKYSPTIQVVHKKPLIISFIRTPPTFIHAYPVRVRTTRRGQPREPTAGSRGMSGIRSRECLGNGPRAGRSHGFVMTSKPRRGGRMNSSAASPRLVRGHTVATDAASAVQSAAIAARTFSTTPVQLSAARASSRPSAKVTPTNRPRRLQPPCNCRRRKTDVWPSPLMVSGQCSAMAGRNEAVLLRSETQRPERRLRAQPRLAQEAATQGRGTQVRHALGGRPDAGAHRADAHREGRCPAVLA